MLRRGAGQCGDLRACWGDTGGVEQGAVLGGMPLGGRRGISVVRGGHKEWCCGEDGGTGGRAMRRGGCARGMVQGSHRGASQAYPSICGTKGGDVAARGQSRRVWVALLGSRGAREEARPRGCWGRGHSLEVDHLLGQAGGIQAKAPQDFSVRIRFPVKCQHGNYSIAAACAQHQLAAGSMLCCQRLAELPCPAGASPGDLRGQPGVTAGTGER